MKKLPFWATIFTVAGFFVLCTLGFWQLQRLEWKEKLLAEVEAEYALDVSQTPLKEENFKSTKAFQRGMLKGEFLNDKEILIGPRTYKGQPGYHVITPFFIKDQNSTVLVNRGWVPLKNDSEIQTPSGTILIQGALRDLPKDNSFTPMNEPTKNAWYRINLEEIANVKEIKKLEPKIFYLEGNGLENIYPISQATKISFNNNHLQYAVFWFAMGVLLMIVYTIRFILNN